MGRHTTNLSDWEHCSLCNMDLNRGVCMCCGTGYKSVCYMYMKGKCEKWALGHNKGCDKHLKKDDIKFPMEFSCPHVKCNDCRDAIDGRYCIRMTFNNEPLCNKCAKKHEKKYLKKPKLLKTERMVIP